MCGGASQVLVVSRSLSQRGPSVTEHQEHAAFGWLDFPLTSHGLVLCKSSPSGGQGLVLSPAGGSGTDTFIVWLHSPIPVTQNHWFQEGVGGGAGRPNKSLQAAKLLYLQGTDRGRTMGNTGWKQSAEQICLGLCCLWKEQYRWQHQEGTGRDAGLHLCDRYPLLPTSPSAVPALTRVRFVPQGTRVKLILVLPRPGSP